MSIQENDLPPVVVSVKTAGRVLDLCRDTIMSMAKKGKLDYVQLTGHKGGITWASIQRLTKGGGRIVMAQIVESPDAAGGGALGDELFPLTKGHPSELRASCDSLTHQSPDKKST
jgi:hypothetical protein